MTSDIPEQVSQERLAQLLARSQVFMDTPCVQLDRLYNASEQQAVIDMHNALRELQQRRLQAETQWVEWKEGAPMPPDGYYWTARENDSGYSYVNESEVAADFVAGWWPTTYRNRVLAYMPCNRPAPYAPPEKGEKA